MQLRVPKLHMGSEHPEAPNPLLKSQCGCGPKLLEGSEYLPNTVQGHSVVTSTQTSERSEHPEASESLSESQYNWEFPNCTWDLNDLKHPNPFWGSRCGCASPNFHGIRTLLRHPKPFWGPGAVVAPSPQAVFAGSPSPLRRPRSGPKPPRRPPGPSRAAPPAGGAGRRRRRP